MVVALRFEPERARGLPSGPVAEPTDLIEALRRVIRASRISDMEAIDPGALAADVEALTTIAEQLEQHRVDDIRMQAALRHADMVERLAASNDRGARAREIGIAGFFPYSPYVGPLNPLAPPIGFDVVDGDPWDELVATHSFSTPYNGPPGAVHGGVISGAIDELLGSVCVLNEVSGFTGTLTIRYRALTPIEEPVRLRGWIDRVEGRKTFAAATFHHGDTLCVEAGGVFIAGADRALFS